MCGSEVKTGLRQKIVEREAGTAFASSSPPVGGDNAEARGTFMRL